MWSFKRTLKEAFDTGGLLLLGLSCLFLFRQHYYPNVFGPMSFGMISVGAIGFVRHIIKELGSRIENTKYQEILLLLEQRQSEIEANRCMLEELRDSCSRFMAMREILESCQGDPSLIEEQAAILAKILQPRDVATSPESTQNTPSDVQIETLAADCPRESENRDLIEGGVCVKNLVQPEQTKRGPKSLKEEALRVRSNIPALLQCHATENFQKEGTRKQYLKVTDESKQVDPESIHAKVTAEYISKQEDIVLKDMDKVGDGEEECKSEGIENMTKSCVQIEEVKNEFEKKESGTLNPEEEKSEDIASRDIQMATEKSD